LDLVEPGRVAELWPMLRTEGVLGAVHLPTDGHVDPASVTSALAAGAREKGARIRQGCRVLAMAHEGGVWRLETTAGEITADIVVNAAGMWAPWVAALAGVRLPITPMEHQYLVTGSMSLDRGSAAELPVLRDPEASYYIREEGEGLLVGPFEPEPVHWATDGVPADFAGQLLRPDLDRIAAVYELATQRVPALADAEIRRVINGPDGYTPDGRCLMGPVPGLEGYYVLAGFSIFGIVFSGGAGRCLAEWIVHGRSSIDVTELDVARFGPADFEPVALLAATSRVYADEYAVHPVTS
jgi:dimethylglycine dehydrogenase